MIDREQTLGACKSLEEELQIVRTSLDSKTTDVVALERTIQTQGMQIKSLEVERDKLKERLHQINEEASKAQNQSQAANNQAMDLADALRVAETLAQVMLGMLVAYFVREAIEIDRLRIIAWLWLWLL